MSQRLTQPTRFKCVASSPQCHLQSEPHLTWEEGARVTTTADPSSETESTFHVTRFSWELHENHLVRNEIPPGCVQNLNKLSDAGTLHQINAGLCSSEKHDVTLGGISLFPCWTNSKNFKIHIICSLAEALSREILNLGTLSMYSVG